MSKKFLALALLAVSLMAPAAYAQEPAVTKTQASQADTTVERRQPDAEAFVRTELFFGTDRQDAADVSKDDLRKFLKEEVTTRFPAGLTILNGTGQFRDLENDKIIRERSMMLILLYPLAEREASNEKIEQIRKEYKRRFKQQSVLRVDDPRPV